jgi:hypothetical protein
MAGLSALILDYGADLQSRNCRRRGRVADRAVSALASCLTHRMMRRPSAVMAVSGAPDGSRRTQRAAGWLFGCRRSRNTGQTVESAARRSLTNHGFSCEVPPDRGNPARFPGLPSPSASKLRPITAQFAGNHLRYARGLRFDRFVTGLVGVSASGASVCSASSAARASMILASEFNCRNVGSGGRTIPTHVRIARSASASVDSCGDRNGRVA